MITVTLDELALSVPDSLWDVVLQTQGFPPCSPDQFPGDTTPIALLDLLPILGVAQSLTLLRQVPGGKSLYYRYLVWEAVEDGVHLKDAASLEALRSLWLYAEGTVANERRERPLPSFLTTQAPGRATMERILRQPTPKLLEILQTGQWNGGCPLPGLLEKSMDDERKMRLFSGLHAELDGYVRSIAQRYVKATNASLPAPTHWALRGDSLLLEMQYECTSKPLSTHLEISLRFFTHPSLAFAELEQKQAADVPAHPRDYVRKMLRRLYKARPKLT